MAKLTSSSSSVKTSPGSAQLNPNFQGSVSTSGNVNAQAQQLINDMQGNSKAWYTDPQNRDSYAAQNQAIKSQLAALGYSADYNSAAGTWGVAGTPTAIPQTSAQMPAPVQLDGLSLGDKYGLTYNMDTIKQILDAATSAEFERKRQEYATTENKFYNQMGATQATALDTIRKSQAQAVATGASRGLSAANQLSAVLGLQQTSAEGANDLANQRNILAASEAEAFTKNASGALETSNAVKQAIANLALTKYGYDTQGRVGEMDFLAALENVAAQKYSADKNLEGVQYNSDSYQKYQASQNNKNTGGGSNTGSGGYYYKGKYVGGNNGDKVDLTQVEGASSETATNSSLLDQWREKIKGAGGNYNPNDGSTSAFYSMDAQGNFVVSGMPNPNTGALEDYTLTPAQFERFLNNGQDINKLTQGTGWKYEANYSVPDTPNINNGSDAEAYYKRTGKVPNGWKRMQTGKDVYTFYKDSGKTTYDNKFDFKGEQGKKVAVGNITWTYSATSGMWKASSGTGTLTNDKFQEYLKKQNPMLVQPIN